MTSTLNEAELMAYADGELDQDERLRIKKLLESDSEARKLVSMFRSTTDAIQQAYIIPPDRRVGQVSLRDGGFSFRRWLDWFGWVVPSGSVPMGALVAGGFLFLIGGGIGFQISQWHQDTVREEVTQSVKELESSLNTALQETLETKLSGSTIQWTSEVSNKVLGTIMPVRTYKNSRDQYCREFRIVIQSVGREHNSRGIACRQAKGSWEMVVQIREGDGFFLIPDGMQMRM